VSVKSGEVQHYDTGGLIETPEYDFKGQPKSTTRKLFKKYKAVANWIDANLVADLEAESFTFITETDALGRITEQTAPDGSIITPSYNEAGLLNSETVTHADTAITTTYIKDIDYNEKGQRNKIIYGNDVITKFYYDKETFRLKRLETKRQNNDPLQDWYYTFDPVGNITHIEDKNIPIIFFDNQKITGLATYTYDALYRLAEATGRENDTPLAFDSKDNWNDAAFMKQLNPGDPMAMRNYTQQYQYDGVGNILQMRHQASDNNWTRNYNYQAANNRLISTQVGNQLGANTYNYPHHDQHGFITAMPHLAEMGWNFKEELVKTIRQRRTDGGTPETTYYQYDGGGQRIRKVTENQVAAGSTPAQKEERIYIAGYELYKKHSGTDAGLERVSLSLMDQQHRFVMIETRNEVDDGTEKHLVRYQLHNHSGSASLELEGSSEARVISYEEYHPYGTTAYQAKNATLKSAAKRYRYTGMERDEESGLEYHSARYYLPWLGRWGSADPIGIGAGVNLYGYVRSNPICFADPEGTEEKSFCADPSNSKDVYCVKLQREVDHWAAVSSQPKSTAQLVLGMSEYDIDIMLSKLGVVDGCEISNTESLVRKRNLLISEMISSYGLSAFTHNSSSNVKILAADIYGNGWVGSEKFVNENIARIAGKYREEILSNIATGPIAAVGYMIDGERGSFAGASIDGLTFSLGLAYKQTNVTTASRVTRVASKAVVNKGTDTAPKVALSHSKVPLPNPGENDMAFGTRAHQELPRIIGETNAGTRGLFNVAPGLTGPDLANPTGMNATFAEMKSLWGSQSPMVSQARKWGFNAQTGRYFFYDRNTGIVFEGIIKTEQYPSGRFRP